MSKFLTFLALTLLSSVLGGGTECEEVTRSPSLPIPDADPAGVSDTLTVGSSFTIADVNVELTIDHTWVGDLNVDLEHGGTTVRIIHRMGLPDDTCCGCSEDNLAGVVLDDDGSGGTIEDACAPDLFSPPNYVPNEALSAFNGMDAQGDWVITVSDNAGGDTGTLESWSLDFCDTPEGAAAGVQQERTDPTQEEIAAKMAANE